MPFTNAKSALLAALLADAKVGTFTGITIQKVGQERGPKGAKVRYGDDKVHAVIFTGFKYRGLCERSLDILSGLSPESVYADMTAEGKMGWLRVWKKSAKVGDLRDVCTSLGLDATGSKAALVARLEAAVPGGMKQVPVSLADVQAAMRELTASLTDSRNGVNESTTDHVYEPLTVGGETVRGARVYVGPSQDAIDNGVQPAATPGTVYLQGLKVQSKVLEPAANGPVPASKSAPRSVAVKWLRYNLPIGKYVSYKLEAGSEFRLAAGGTALVEATEMGMIFTEEVQQAVTRSLANAS